MDSANTISVWPHATPSEQLIAYYVRWHIANTRDVTSQVIFDMSKLEQMAGTSELSDQHIPMNHNDIDAADPSNRADLKMSSRVSIIIQKLMDL